MLTGNIGKKEGNIEKKDVNIGKNAIVDFPKISTPEKTLPPPEKLLSVRKREVLDLKKEIKKSVYTTIPAKLPLKSIMIEEYLQLCEDKKITPKFTRAKLEKGIKKQELWKLIQSIKQDEDEPVKAGEKVMIKLTARKKRSTAEFLYNMQWALNYGAEKFVKNRPGFKVNIDGFAKHTEENKKDMIEDLTEIVEDYPHITNWLSPIMKYVGKQSMTLVKSADWNKKKVDNRPRVDVQAIQVPKVTRVRKRKGKEIPLCIAKGAIPV